MGKHQKNWSQTEKMAIVDFYKKNGIGKTSKEFNVSTGPPVRCYHLPLGCAL